MEKGTQEFKRSVKGTLSAGFSSLMGGDGNRYFIIEFKFDSKTHHQGESKPIIVDEAFIGRLPECQILIDEEFDTVSRKHAVIRKVGEDTWVLTHLSQTNATYVNGQQVVDSVTLKNGDEIQLSSGGPRLGFIIPQGEKAFTKSIGMSQRFNEFRKQALRPYRTAIILIVLLFALVIAGLIWALRSENGIVNDLRDNIELMQAKIESDSAKIAELEKRRGGRGKGVLSDPFGVNNSSRHVDGTGVEMFEDYVYFVRLASITVTIEPETPAYEWMKDELKGGNTWTYQFPEKNKYSRFATGFITSDGYFITSRSAIEPWAYLENIEDWDDPLLYAAILSYEGAGGTIDAVYHIESKTGDRRNLFFREFTVLRHSDKNMELESDNPTIPYHIKQAMSYNDFAYVKLPLKSNLVVNRDLSTKIPARTNLDILGFPNGIGADKNIIKPQYTYATASNTGLYKGRIPVTGANLETGNAGGPVFCKSNDGRYYVVGIVSREIGKHGGVIVPMSQITY